MAKANGKWQMANGKWLIQAKGKTVKP